jgi:hypothetical protein
LDRWIAERREPIAYTVSFDEKDGIVCVTVSGEATKGEHFAARDKALSLCEEHGCGKILVDLHDLACSSLSTMEAFYFGERIAKFPRLIRLAHVLPKHPKSRQNVIFSSNVQANRGKETGEFNRVEEARNWLVGGK